MKEKILWGLGSAILGAILAVCYINFPRFGMRWHMGYGPGMMMSQNMSGGCGMMMEKNAKMFKDGKSMMDQKMKCMMHDEMSMDSMMMDMTMALKGKTGEDLDKAFLQEMIVHHQGAVEMAKMLKDGKNPELKKFGEQIISAQTKEIQQMQDWLKAWYK